MLSYWFSLVSALLLTYLLLGWGGWGVWGGMLTFIYTSIPHLSYATLLVTTCVMEHKKNCEADDVPKKKKSFGKIHNPNFDNEDFKIDTAPQRHEHFREDRMRFVPRLSKGRAPCS